MKKLLGSTLVLALLFPSQASAAELLKNMKFSGQIDIQMTAGRNITDFQTRAENDGTTVGQDRIGDAQNRIMVSIDGDLLDDVHARTTLSKSNRVWGNSSERFNNAVANTGVLNTIEVHEANIKIDKLMGAIDGRFGRQFYGQAGDLIAYYGPSDKALYGLPVSAIDAARFDWSGEFMNASILAGKADANAAILGAGPFAPDHQDIRALILSCKGQGTVKGSAYLWNKATHRDNAGYGTGPSEAAAGAKNDNLYIAGIKAKADMGGAFVNAEFAKNFGIQRQTGSTTLAPTASYTGWAFKADGGYKMDISGMGAFTPWGMFAIGTGRSNTRENRNEDFQTINSDFRPGSIYGRFASFTGSSATLGSGVSASIASNGLTNRVIWGVGVKATPAAINKLTAGISYYNYKFHRITRSPATTAATIAGNGNKNIGAEADLDLEWKHSENVSLMGGVGTFQPGGFIKETVQSTNASQASANSQRPVNPATLAYFDVRVKFGGM